MKLSSAFVEEGLVLPTAGDSRAPQTEARDTKPSFLTPVEPVNEQATS